MRLVFLAGLILLISGCQKEVITFSENVSETFYVNDAGASMRVLVEGNTTSNTFILIIHGGPGASSFVYNSKYISQNLEDKYALVYWDQRNAGASQGSSNGNNLHLNKMVDDLKKVIEVLKYRYGQNMNLFLLGHSFGGLVAADFVTRPDYQNMIKGLIDVDGSHNYPLNDTLTKQMLLNTGISQVSQGKNNSKWEPIVSYCKSHTGDFTFEESQKLQSYAEKAEGYIDSVKKIDFVGIVLSHSVTERSPLTSILVNLLYSEDSDFNKELFVANYSGLLYRVTIPVLILWGKYDFICPVDLGLDFYNRISSAEKKMVISPYSGHNIMLQDEKLFCDEINAFVQRNR
jgi:pimeloyl-ACP methyl ester carboxylesterase